MWNTMRKKPKIIQVPMSDDLLEQLDSYSSERGQSRSAFIREACSEYVAKLTEAELDRQYIQAYVDMPETQGEREWAEFGLQMLGELTKDDDWSDWPGWPGEM
jgi:metal-responsive CopG/Arc/MetJ family transcriptional regulator